jgi:hypothetical protein
LIPQFVDTSQPSTDNCFAIWRLTNPDNMTTLYNIGDIQAALGLKVTAEMIETVFGVVAHSSEKRARFFTEEQFEQGIKPGLVRHVQGATIKSSVPHHSRTPKPATAAKTAPAAAPTKGFDDEDDDEL